MKLIGNFKDWIKPEWIAELLRSRGTGRFSEGQQPNSENMDLQWKKAVDAGYDPKAVYFYMFDKSNVSFEIIPPWVQNEKYHWWITKMLPGNCMPMHVDPHTTYEKNSKRYWMPFQDYESGHFFIYNDFALTDYKAGDVYQYTNSQDPHGAFNIGYSPRLVLQVSTWE